MDGAPVRVDAWVWAVRLAPTRTAAGAACASGRVRVAGETVKPARKVTVGDEVEVRRPGHRLTVRVVSTISKRVGAPVAVQCYEVLGEERDQTGSVTGDVAAWAQRDPGAGRPTKRDRRQLDRWRGS